jgi:hypothetical protein
MQIRFESVQITRGCEALELVVTCSLLFIQLSNIWTMGWPLFVSSSPPPPAHDMVCLPLKNIIFLNRTHLHVLFPPLFKQCLNTSTVWLKRKIKMRGDLMKPPALSTIRTTQYITSWVGNLWISATEWSVLICWHLGIYNATFSVTALIISRNCGPNIAPGRNKDHI